MEKRKLLGEMLIDEGLITPEQLNKAIELQKNSGLRLGQVLIRMGLVSEEGMIATLGDQAGIPYVNLDNYIIDPKVLALIPENLARTFLIIPLFRIAHTLTIAMADPLNVKAIDEVRRRAGCEVDTAVSTEEQIRRAVDSCYGISSSIEDIVKEALEGDLKVTVEGTEGETAPEGPIIRLVNLIIFQAVRDNVSDIHIEPDEHKLGIRYRIDGILHESGAPPKHLQAALISRIKVMANMDIAETRAPQDGRFQINSEGKNIEFRISSFPTIYGENIVLRILDQSKAVLNMEELGFAPEILERYRTLLKSPYGIILVTGPTGSGKTTTLYASLNAINSIDKNIITIEDPVEYRLKLIRQTQINPKAGITFASGMRSILRQDPDVIMVGEMRDLETAEMAFQAALTGHLVFSTLHTNDSVGALARLLHLGIEPFLVASSTVAVLAQRLVRTICPNCKTAHSPSQEEMKSFRLEQREGYEFYRGKGCKACRNTGYKGRIGIYELLTVNEPIRKLILENGSATVIRETARQSQEMKMLREDGLAKACRGITTLEEVNRTTFEE
ncbi:MAG: ATPase, T2SS/T4P/T4SS family [Proteobacteria bacterium]|nr:ATPase, T2SS/T4P/T4SS family [Pseudomonadota bacterium]